ncbi:SDR family oxidoreductase [Flammeovirga sp. MY04]|uniref:SDR family oxidoreductase n=1 Tax=Flammeovirga sp. MY04 TaxID=1191459 RepID=UPI0008062DDD|nr:SDR family oxidoreductase [Flammeovirga sp. MY04]ANQ48320.1 SDR family oxidoreductase [Flammeovirga sp. MY04]
MNTKKLALVTGANRGIGYAIAKGLLSDGYMVLVTSRNKIDGEKATQKLKEFGDAHYFPLDVSEDSSIHQLNQYVSKEFGKLDVLINNAGINYDTWQTTLEADLAEVHQTIETNVMGPWKMMQSFVPLMKKNNYGRIVNVSSGSGAMNGMGGGTPGYSVSKTALNVLTIKVAAEVGGHNILVNSVCPGWVKTDMGGSGAPRSPEEGAETIVWAAKLEDQSMNGKFFRDKKEIPW